MGELALELRGLSKVFEGQRALDDVDLDLAYGEVHALLGPNGCGKSTLIKILAGYHTAEPGAIARVHGREHDFTAPSSSAGMAFIHQDLGVIDDLDVVDNMALGLGYERPWWISDRSERRRAQQTLAGLGADIDVTATLGSVSRAQQAMVAIARAVGGDLGERPIVVFDEPTAALPQREVGQLFTTIRSIRERGGAILYVTHRLNEVLELADRVTVLRDGRKVVTRPRAGLTHDELVTLIVGREVTPFVSSRVPQRTDVVLRVEGLETQLIRDASLDVHEGEVLGITGLVGSGCDELLGAVFGGVQRFAGSVFLDGVECPASDPRASIAAGIAYAPADRKRLSAIVDWTLRENVTLPRIDSSRILGWLGTRREAAEVQPMLDALGVAPPDPERSFVSLSGGNQQKVVLARWLRNRSKVYLLDEPTNGVDMGARQAIYEALAEVASGGSSVVLTSQDAEELVAVCDRVLVMRDGYVVAELAGDELTEERVTSATLRQSDQPVDEPDQQLPGQAGAAPHGELR